MKNWTCLDYTPSSDSVPALQNSGLDLHVLSGLVAEHLCTRSFHFLRAAWYLCTAEATDVVDIEQPPLSWSWSAPPKQVRMRTRLLLCFKVIRAVYSLLALSKRASRFCYFSLVVSARQRAWICSPSVAVQLFVFVSVSHAGPKTKGFLTPSNLSSS